MEVSCDISKNCLNGIMGWKPDEITEKWVKENKRKMFVLMRISWTYFNKNGKNSIRRERLTSR